MIARIVQLVLASLLLSGCVAAKVAQRVDDLEGLTVQALVTSATLNQGERFDFDGYARFIRQHMADAYQSEIIRCEVDGLRKETETPLKCKARVSGEALEWLEKNKPDLYIEKATAKIHEVLEEWRRMKAERDAAE